jgi:hypothetical protein
MAGDEVAKQGDLTITSLPDAASYWGEFGRPGWIGSRWLDAGEPWVLAGLARGAFHLDEPGRGPLDLTDPTSEGSITPLVWFDSLRIGYGEGAATEGYSGALATVETNPAGVGPERTRSVVDLRSGDYGWDENSVMIERRDSTTWLRGEALSINRNFFGSYEPAGRHQWGLSGGARRGPHEIQASFAQRGVASRLAGSEQENTTSRAGSAGYGFSTKEFQSNVEFRRGEDHRESVSDFFDLSRRDASAWAVDGTVRHRSGLLASFDYEEQRVTRTVSEDFEARSRRAWAALRWTRPAGDGVLDLELGGGRHSGFDTPQFAPGITYRIERPSFRLRIGAERVLYAVWSDLEPAQDPFMQQTWAGVVDVSMGPDHLRHLGLVLLGGRTTSRALVARQPLTDVALRVGLFEDTEPYDFGLAAFEGRWNWGIVFATGQVFGLVRKASDLQPLVDPGYGGRAVVGTNFRLFQGDLGVGIYAGAENVGERQSEESSDRVLPGYTTSSAGIVLTLADAIVSVRARNLENEVHEEPWIDSSVGLEALGPGREIRFALTLLLGD